MNTLNEPIAQCTLKIISSKKHYRRMYVSDTRLCLKSIAGVPLHLTPEEFGELEAAIIAQAGERAETFYRLLNEIVFLEDRFMLDEHSFILYSKPEHWPIVSIDVALAFTEAYDFHSLAIIDAVP